MRRTVEEGVGYFGGGESVVIVHIKTTHIRGKRDRTD